MNDRRQLMSASLACAAGSLLATHWVQANDAPVADTLSGKVRGHLDRDIRIFKGIPYARAERFGAPKAATPWAGVRDALAFGAMSPQSRGAVGSLFASWTFDKEMSEDCQLLNIWTPGLRDGVKRPVMVWLHGGDFSSLSGSRNVFDGTRLCRKGDVVVVTLNHRLNLFGYLHLAELASGFPDAANAGMLDIVAALQWVKTHIAEFGGDPANVTIFGQSGGGAKVTTLMAMPAAQGLYHKAIVQSGSYYLQAMDAATGTRQTLALLEALDIKVGDAARLASLPTERLVEGLAKAMRGPARANYRPVVDGRHLPAGPWSPQAPALSASIPLMVGTTATEMTLLTGSRDASAFTLDEAGLRQRMAAWFRPEDFDKVIATFRQSRPKASASDLFFAMDTDKFTREGAWQQVERRVAQQAAPAWLYELDWVTPVDGGKWGSPHSLDLAMVFDNVAVSASMVGTGPEAQRVADQMSAAWLAFARNGRPNAPGVPTWPAYDTNRRATMVFDEQSRVIEDFRGEERILLAGLKPPT